ncbi:MAG TPA: (deoxy)nucleoside triphosphate pyrophosphohydrolase [Bryobacteraceae bacterium]|nr:(deoxy)nucleoside triphosphate pyrophosphohydrolase [Bryobacteraceae bacterium]
MTPGLTTVVAAIIRRGARILICRRRAAQAHALKWEFPGGKVEAGENPPQALCRELREELAVRARIGDEVERYEFRYPGRNPILLIFYTVTDFDGEPHNCVFDEIRWVAPADLPQFDFLEGDVEFVKRLAIGGV